MSIVPNKYQQGMNRASEIYEKEISELKETIKKLKQEIEQLSYSNDDFTVGDYDYEEDKK